MNRSRFGPRGIPVLLVVMYGVGAVGHLAAPLRDLMVRITPLILVGLGALVLAVSPRESPRGERRRMLVWALATYAATFAVEAIGVATGAVFGFYTYGAALGLSVLGVPLVIGFNWLLVVLGALRLAERLEQAQPRTAVLVPLVTGVLTVAFDWVMEPVAMALDYWQWQGGVIPLRNYAAWLVVATAAAAAYRRAGIASRDLLPAAYFAVQLVFFAVLRLAL